MNRIETLRNQALTNYPSREEALYRFHKKFEELGSFGYGVNFILPARSQFSTVIGTALSGL